MDQQLEPSELLRFLQVEAETLQQIQIKIANELHHLQVEEAVFVHTVERLNENARRNQSTTITKGTTEAGMELLEALHKELALAVPLMSTLPPDSAPTTTPSLYLVSRLPPDLALPTTLHPITETESAGDKDLTVEPPFAAPSGMGFDDDVYEYELLGNLEADDEQL